MKLPPPLGRPCNPVTFRGEWIISQPDIASKISLELSRGPPKVQGHVSMSGFLQLVDCGVFESLPATKKLKGELLICNLINKRTLSAPTVEGCRWQLYKFSF